MPTGAHPRPHAGSFSSCPSRELRAGRAVARTAANIEETLEGAEGDFTVRSALKAEMRLIDEVEEVVVPGVHLDDAPTTDEGLGEGETLP